ncbi:MAG: aminodeoxychorismate synthase component I [Desulfurivibrio sp.]|nr:aminodeoxychorismate synthase component I [Desulfurivibrio sp.]
MLLESGRITPEDHRSLLFLNPRGLLRLESDAEPADFFAATDRELNRGHYLAGWFAYELGYLLEPRLRPLLPANAGPLAVLGIFSRPLIYNHLRGEWEGAGHTPHSAPPPAPAATAPHAPGMADAATEQPTSPQSGEQGDRLPSRSSVQRQQYCRHIEKIRRYIAAGDTYQVNYTLKQYLPCQQDAATLYRSLRRNQRVCYAGLLKLAGNTVLSFSPELFFRKQGKQCRVRPMKGTSRRGLTPEEDSRRATALQQDSKNRSENVMIVDLLRNDLGRLCQPGSVQTSSLFDIESYETLHQMTSTIHGELRPGLSTAAIFQALFPCGSVTGAPKIRTMEIIRELETEPRGVYTGALGFMAPDGEMVFNVPIRTVTLEAPGQAVLGIGSGIVYDSKPEQEWRECILKGDFLSRPTPPMLLIETLLWQPGRGYRLLELHLERLLASAATLGFYAEEREIRQLLASRQTAFQQPQRVRLTLAKDGELNLEATEFQAAGPFDWRELPATTGELPRIRLSQQSIDPDQPLLYHKTSHRQLYDRERQAALAAGCCEVLFTNTRGELTEGAISNLFIRRAGRLLTPPLHAGLLNGVLRRHLLAQGEPPLHEEQLHPTELATAEAIYIGNALRGLTRVRL